MIRGFIDYVDYSDYSDYFNSAADTTTFTIKCIIRVFNKISAII